MTRPYTADHRATWEALIGEALRLQNDKVRDFGPVKRAAAAGSRAVFPAGYDGRGNPFSLLIRAVEALPGTHAGFRARVLSNAKACAAILTPVAADPAAEPDQASTQQQRRRDIYD